MRLLITDTDFLENRDEFDNYLSCIDAQRTEKINRYKREEDKKRSLTAGLLFKKICKDEGVEPIITVNGYGKPYINGNKLYFNLSHSGKYVACAYSDKEIGVDIQQHIVIKEAMLSRFLNPYEIDELPQDMDERISEVNRLWSIKESYIKMLGMGMAYDMRNCMVNKDKKKVIDNTGNYTKAYYRDFLIEDEYYLSVCSPENDLPESFEHIFI